MIAFPISPLSSDLTNPLAQTSTGAGEAAIGFFDLFMSLNMEDPEASSLGLSDSFSDSKPNPLSQNAADMICNDNKEKADDPDHPLFPLGLVEPSQVLITALPITTVVARGNQSDTLEEQDGSEDLAAVLEASTIEPSSRPTSPAESSAPRVAPQSLSGAAAELGLESPHMARVEHSPAEAPIEHSVDNADWIRTALLPRSDPEEPYTGTPVRENALDAVAPSRSEVGRTVQKESFRLILKPPPAETSSPSLGSGGETIPVQRVALKPVTTPMHEPVRLLTQSAPIVGGVDGAQAPPHFATRNRAIAVVEHVPSTIRPARALTETDGQTIQTPTDFTTPAQHNPERATLRSQPAIRSEWEAEPVSVHSTVEVHSERQSEKGGPDTDDDLGRRTAAQNVTHLRQDTHAAGEPAPSVASLSVQATSGQTTLPASPTAMAPERPQAEIPETYMPAETTSQVGPSPQIREVEIAVSPATGHGRVEVRLSEHKGHIHVQVNASHAETRTVLEKEVKTLIQALEETGFRNASRDPSQPETVTVPKETLRESSPEVTSSTDALEQRREMPEAPHLESGGSPGEGRSGGGKPDHQQSPKDTPRKRRTAAHGWQQTAKEIPWITSQV